MIQQWRASIWGGAGKVLEPHGVSRQRLKEGVSETWCWHDRHSVNSQSHYLSGVAWMELASICANQFAKGDLIGWRLCWSLKSLKVFHFCHEQRQWSDTTDPQFRSATLDVTFKVNERRWRRRPVWMGHYTPVHLPTTLWRQSAFRPRIWAIQPSPLTLYCGKLSPCHFWLITKKQNNV